MNLASLFIYCINESGDMSCNHFYKILNNWQIGGRISEKKSSDNIFLIYIKKNSNT